MYHFMTEKTSHEWWITKGCYRLSDVPTIHWDLCWQAISNLPPGKTRFASKWYSGYMGAGSKMKQWKVRAGDNCPFCMHPNEDTTHMLQCPHPNALEIWDIQLNSFVDKLEKYGTCLNLLTAIHTDLDQWQRKLPMSSLTFLPHQLISVKQGMRNISYFKFIEGLLPKSLIQYQILLIPP